MGLLGQGRLSVQPLPVALQAAKWTPGLSLQVRLEAALDAPVNLWLTDNRRSMISIQLEDSGEYRIRLHHMFTDAVEAEIKALAELAGGGAPRPARAVLRAFTTRHRALIRTPKVARRVRVRTQGANHDLQPLFESAASDIAEKLGPVTISWGRWGHHGPLRHVRLGSYCRRRRLVRIHPLLDRPDVPAWVIRFVIFHELLHEVVPTRRFGSRRVQHGADFRQREEAHPDHARFKRWCAGHLQTIMAEPR